MEAFPFTIESFHEQSEQIKNLSLDLNLHLACLDLHAVDILRGKKP